MDTVETHLSSLLHFSDSRVWGGEEDGVEGVVWRNGGMPCVKSVAVLLGIIVKPGAEDEHHVRNMQGASTPA